MKISQMRYFSAACHLGSITQAADFLHISQPAITASIKAMEDELGVSLLYRSKKAVMPTEDGEAFLKRCDEIITDIDGLVTDFQKISTERHTISVGIPPMIGYFLFPQIFAEFRRDYPEIDIQLTETGSESAKLLVKKGALELAIITMGDCPPPGLSARKMIKTQLLYCVGAKHRLALRKSVDLKEINDDPLILFTNGYYHKELVHKRFEEAEIEPNVIFNSNQVLTIKGFVRNNIAGAFLLPQIIEEGEGIIGLPINDPMLLNVAIVWRKDEFLTKESKQFIRFIKSRFDIG